MQRKNILLLYTGLMCFFCGYLAKAQSITFTGIDTPPPPLHFTITGGYSLPNITGQYITNQGYGSNGGNINPINLELGYNYSKQGLVSLYLSETQTSTGNFFWADTANNLYAYSYSVSIFTIGLSTAYHFGNSDHLSPYVGGMIGYRFVNILTNGDLPIVGSTNLSIQPIAYQFYGGCTWYFIKWMGLDARVSYGNSYYAQLGLSFRFQIERDDE